MKPFSNKKAIFKTTILGTLVSVGMVLGALSTTANASEFGVRVVDESGRPVQGASVCFGLPGSFRQFGAHFTNADGHVKAEVPNIPFVVTVSKTRFSGVRLSEPARGFNLVKQVTLAEGTPGPRCKAGSTLAEADQSSVRVTKLDVRTEPQATVITPTATGEPTEYRVDITDSLENTRWNTFNGAIRVTGSMAMKDELFLQLRRYEGTTSGWLEAQSRVITVPVPRELAPL